MTSIVEVYRRWPTHDDCIGHLERVRWGDKPLCPYCGAEAVSRHREAGRRDRHQCQRCMKSFSVTVGTIFHNSHVDLQRWFLLISLMLTAKKGLSAMQAARNLEMRRPTVWSMMHRVRKALADDGKLLADIVDHPGHGLRLVVVDRVLDAPLGVAPDQSAAERAYSGHFPAILAMQAKPPKG